MMEIGAFKAERRERLIVGDDALRPAVSEGLLAYMNGESDWAERIVDAASQIWLENFQAEAPGARFDSRLARFRESMGESLSKTAQPSLVVTNGQIDRVARWASTMSVNAGTIEGSSAVRVTYKMWLTMDDEDVREIHRPLDGRIVPMGSTFDVNGSRLPWPGVPVGPAEGWIECRCVAMPASRQGEAMSANTFTIGPEDSVDDNGDVVLGYDVVTADAVVTDDDVRTGAVVEWNGENGTTYYGPFDTAENAHRWIESDNAPWDGEASVIQMTRVPQDAEVIEPEDEAPQVGAVDDDADEEPITEIPIHGVLAPEGIATGDARGFRNGALSTRPLPVPYRYERVGTHGGQTSDVVTVGRIDEAWLHEPTNEWRFRGAIVLALPHANEAIDQIVSGTSPGLSIDADDMEQDVSEFFDAEGNFIETPFDLETAGKPQMTWWKSARIAGATQVPIPAFYQSYTALGHDFAEDLDDTEREALAACGCIDGVEELDAAVLAAAFAPGTKDGPGWITNPAATARIRRYWTKPGEVGYAKIGWGSPGDFNRCRALLAEYVQNPDWLAGLCANMHKEALGFWPAEHARKGSHAALVASGAVPADMMTLVASPGATVYPAAAFAQPDEGRAFPMRIDRETRTIVGYAAQWGSCHIGITGVCKEPPHSRTNYSYFRKGIVETEAGEQNVALITYGIGHASHLARAAAATAHYDQPDAVRAYINIGEDAYGIWYAGVLAPWVTDQDIDAMLAIRRVSGDWRNWSGRRDDLEMVGLVVVNTDGYQLAASGGIQTAAIGLGVVDTEDDEPGQTHEEFVAAVATAVASIMKNREREEALRQRSLALRARDVRARAGRI